jgi:enamine deaminase RidA (YjgF/YER057c/UK114 family)
MASGELGRPAKLARSAPELAHYPPADHMSAAIESAGFIFLSGQTGMRPDGTISSDPEAPIRDAFHFLCMNLASAGLGFEDVVEMATYHVGLRQHLDLFIQIKGEHVFEPCPAWSAIGISELWTPGSIIGIRAIARCRHNQGD